MDMESEAGAEIDLSRVIIIFLWELWSNASSRNAI